MTNQLHHPSVCLTPEQTTIIRNNVHKAEAAEQLQPEQIALAVEQRWFTMLVPLQYNGLQKALPEMVRLEEAIAWADGSMGWVVTLCSGAGWFGGFMQPSLADAVFANPHACLAGSGAATGTAEETAEGYLVSGKWWHASGAPHNTVFTANCRLVKEGKVLTDAAGQPLVKAFALMREEVTLIPTWQSFGLVATASHAFEVQQLLVPANRLFAIEPDAAIIKAPLYQYPFLQLAEVTLAANISGMALHFIEEAEAIVQQKNEKEQPVAQQYVRDAQEMMEQARRIFYTSLDASWQQQVFTGEVSVEALQEISVAARTLAAKSIQAVQMLYSYCGLAAANKHSVINQVWRDIHTASQHSLLVYPR
ncbi:Acyl-CoA dehydrogenase [Filimonas lacunae]|uniref:Acyl-CoA dehydrogenase n=1 Tax=Filimonas lacunae TaxID=477680 RepID=A0A173MR55_9BACT|nr:hypothetical protein [Filimonas lacunae]BAV09861.1 acyl-CoA dehydrogenase [Filimonas lacunae]SIS80104.1 Acyl-CoA dehydrogenase [Filimonas lacunae]